MISVTVQGVPIASDNRRMVPTIQGMRRGKDGQYRCPGCGKTLKMAARQVPTSEYKRSKKSLVEVLSAARMASKEELPYDRGITLKVMAKTYKDVTNLIKIVADSLEEAKIIKDDRYITHCLLVKKQGKRGEDDVLEIQVSGYRKGSGDWEEKVAHGEE